MLDNEGMYFISFATINWIDVFIRQEYFELICDSLNYCVKHNSAIDYCGKKGEADTCLMQ